MGGICRTENPRQDVGYRGENTAGRKKHPKVADTNRSARRNEDISNCSNHGQKCDHQTTLLISIRDPSSDDGHQKGQEKRRGSETLRVNRSEAHVIEDRWKKNRER